MQDSTLLEGYKVSPACSSLSSVKVKTLEGRKQVASNKDCGICVYLLMSKRIIWRAAEEACSRKWEFRNGQEEMNDRKADGRTFRILTSRTFMQRYEAERHIHFFPHRE